MTNSQIAERVSQTLEDEGLVHFTTEDLYDSIQDGYELVSLLCETIEKVVQITIPANSQIVDLSAIVNDYYRPICLYSETTKRWLFPRSFESIRENGVSWANNTGAVREWCPLGDRYCLFYPSPLDTQTFQLFYRAEPTKLSASDSPTFYSDAHKVLEFYACSDLLDINLEYDKSMKFFELFMTEVEEIRTRLNKRGLKAMILELSCQSIVTPI